MVHFYLAEGISGNQAKHIVKTALSNYNLPYISLSPVITYCPECGVLETTDAVCPKCGGTVRHMQKITGYVRDVANFNPGKRQEFEERNQLDGTI